MQQNKRILLKCDSLFVIVQIFWSKIIRQECKNVIYKTQILKYQAILHCHNAYVFDLSFVPKTEKAIKEAKSRPVIG